MRETRRSQKGSARVARRGRTSRTDRARACTLYSFSSCHDHTIQQNVSNCRLCARTSSVSDCIGPSEFESLTGLVALSSCWGRLRCCTRHLGHMSTHGPATSSGKVASFPPRRNREFEGKLLCRSLATQLRSESVVHYNVTTLHAVIGRSWAGRHGNLCEYSVASLVEVR